MQKMAQGWFSGGSSEDQQQKPASSLLADWNSYAASRDTNESTGSGIGFDLEAAVRSANDSVTGTFNVVSKGVRDIPGNFQSATSNIPSGKALMYFGLFLATGVFFFHCICDVPACHSTDAPEICNMFYTRMCLHHFIILALKGPKNQFVHMTSKARLPFTLGFIGSMVGTICLNGASQLYSFCAFLRNTVSAIL
ncbi:hypothetical protein GH714_000558 [Hevea brasiliensis]|uniref:Vesicle transport protein n=1 Tax=Hevea brasiliensis TaxID=3981 RepID=A0A6A6NFE2_HEVBR|nr:hypothetical protein GH714_000558 [Hevea brasiliensis]